MKNGPSKVSDREIVIMRIFDAPRELVFNAWIDPAHLGNWWGPNGFTCTFQEFDPRPGGVWRFIMHGPDGTDYPNRIIYGEIKRPERIVFHHVLGNYFQVTANFEEISGKTRLTMQMLFDSAEECDRIKAFAVDGNRQTMSRLEAYLHKLA